MLKSVYAVVSCCASALICLERLSRALRPSTVALVFASRLFSGLFFSHFHKGYWHSISYTNASNYFVSFGASGGLLRPSSFNCSNS